MKVTVEELMSTPAVCCRTDDTLSTAARLMWEHDCGALPVTDDDGRMVGIVTDRDICMATYTQGKPPQAIRVADAMASEVFACQADDSVQSVVRLMGDKQIRRTPIVDDENHPIGVISLGNIALHAASLDKKNGLDREFVRVFAAVSQPRPEATSDDGRS